MKNIIFIASPAAGKGTQSDLLVKKYGFSHISTGDLLREEIANETELGKEISGIMQNGGLVSTEIVNKLLKNKLESDKTSVGFIFDGYPRKIEQCYDLDEILKSLSMNIDKVLYLKVSEQTAMERALGRMTCPKCGKIYNKYNEAIKPKVDNTCDDCNVTLDSRSDDNEESFKNRYKTFIESSEPILNYYEKLGILNEVDCSRSPEDIFKDIEGLI